MLRRKRKTITAAKAAFGFLGGISLLLWIQSKNITFKANPEDVSSYIESRASDYQLNPEGIFALALGQSKLNPQAERKNRRGIMLISKDAWQKISPEPWENAFHWRLNINVTLQYLNYLQALEPQPIKFSKLISLYLETNASKDPILQRILEGHYDIDK